MHVKKTQNTYCGRVGVYPGFSGSHSKLPCLQVSSGFQAAVLKCAFEASLVSLPEMYNNNNNVGLPLIQKSLNNLKIVKKQNIFCGHMSPYLFQWPHFWEWMATGLAAVTSTNWTEELLFDDLFLWVVRMIGEYDLLWIILWNNGEIQIALYTTTQLLELVHLASCKLSLAGL